MISSISRIRRLAFQRWNSNNGSLSELKYFIGTQVRWRRLSTDDSPEHPTDGWPIDSSFVDGKSNDASCTLVHDDHDPVSIQDERFTSKQVHGPEAVLAVPEEG